MCSDCAHTSGAAEPWKYTCGVRFSCRRPMQVYREIRLTRDLALYIRGQPLRLTAVCVAREFAVQVAAVAREHVVAALDKPVVIERVYYRYLAAHVFRVSMRFASFCAASIPTYSRLCTPALTTILGPDCAPRIRAVFGVFQRRTRNVYNVPYLFCLRLIVHAYHPPVAAASPRFVCN